MVRASSRTARIALAVGLLAFPLTVPATAMVPIEPEVASALDRAPVGRVLRLQAFPLDDGTTIELELERFEVWAPGAVVVERRKDGERSLPPPVTHYFRGRVAGDPDSWVFLAKDDTIRGFVATGGRLYAIAPAEDAYRGARRGSESMVRAIDRELDSPLHRPLFRCDNEGLNLFPPAGVPAAVAHEGLLAHAMSNGKTYKATVAIDTDYELYQHFGSTEALTGYVSDLVAASSAIYYRDVQTVLTLGNVYTYSTNSYPDEPWTATSTAGALYEIGDYWHANRSAVPRTTVHFLSHKGMGGGISWLGVLCQSDFLCQNNNCGDPSANGHYGGAYGVSASLDGEFSTTNPSLYWDILCFTHELGHNFDADHTHCYSPQVDQCCICGAETCPGSGCPGPVPAGGGTIMSYCHCVSGGNNNITLYLGFSGQASQVVLDAMRSHIESRATIYPSCMPELLQLTVNRNGTGSGTVTSNPTGINCGATCTALFVRNASVTLTAAAAGGSTFAGWSGSGCSGTGTCQVTMDAAKSVTATFNLPVQYTLDVSKDGAGTGTVTSVPAAISCGATCSASFNQGATVNLTATPTVGSAFGGWSGVCAGTGVCQVTMSAARNVTATFNDVTACTTTVTDQAFTGTQLYESCHGIYAGPNVSVTTLSGHLTLRAASLVVLRNGFSVGSSGRLTVALDPSLAGT